MDTESTLRAGRMSRVSLIVIALAIALGAVIAFQGAAGAQNGETSFPLPITKFDCEADPGTIGQAVIPDGCVVVEGVSMTVFDTSGNELGSCVTGAGGSCTVDVDVPDDATVRVEEDESTATAGYSPRENPVEVEIVNEFSEAQLVNIKDEPKLPNTGSGSAAAAYAVGTGNIVGLLAVMATLLALGGAVLRRSDAD